MISRVFVIARFFIMCCFITLISSINGQNLFDKQHSIVFANYLMDQGLYNLAVPEMEKLNFEYKNDDSLQFLLLKAYRKSGRVKQGIERASDLFKNYANVPSLASKEYFSLLALNHDINKANQLLTKNLHIDNKHKRRYEIHLALLSKDWNKSSLLYTEYSSGNELLNCYKPCIDEATNIHYKSAFLAGTISTLIPGAGKVYTGFMQDGLLSFLSIGVSGWQAYSGFEKDGKNSVYGWSFAGIAGILYLANIYGSAKSANYINHYNEEKIIQKTQHCLDNDF